MKSFGLIAIVVFVFGIVLAFPFGVSVEATSNLW